MHIAVTVVLGIVINLNASGQLAQMKAGPETQRLNFLRGTWVTEEAQTIAGGRHVVRSTASYEWLPGEVWLRGTTTVTGLPGIDTLHAWTQFTYDARSKEYVMVHTDNQSAVFESRGRWKDDTTLVLEGTHEWAGKTVHRRTILTRVSTDEFSREYLTSDDGVNYVGRNLSRNVRQR